MPCFRHLLAVFDIDSGLVLVDNGCRRTGIRKILARRRECVLIPVSVPFREAVLMLRKESPMRVAGEDMDESAVRITMKRVLVLLGSWWRGGMLCHGRRLERMKDGSELIMVDGGFPPLDFMMCSFFVHERDGIVLTAGNRLLKEPFLFQKRSCGRALSVFPLMRAMQLPLPSLMEGLPGEPVPE